MLTIKLLGQFEICANGEPLALPTRASQTLAAWLLLKPGITHRREHVAGTIWPDSTEKNARGNLRHALWELRQVIPDGYVQADQMSITWRSGAAYQLDVDLLLQNGEANKSAAQVALAVTAYGGELLPGFYEDWVSLERERLHARFEERSARLLELLLAEQRWRDALEQAERWIALGHTPEPAYRALMTAHAALGDLAGVSKAWQRCVDALGRELGVPPSPETAGLYERYRSGFRPDKMTEWQDGRVHSNSPRHPLALPPLHPSTLPAQTTPFVGRAREVAALRELLADPTQRLVTILGAGGMGKSRLALAVAAGEQENFPDGVCFVPLAAVENPAALASAILAALPTQYQNDTRPPQQQLLAHLAGRRLLLLLDNFEHLIDGGELLVEMLQTAPGLHLLVTSRERLRLQAETIFRLGGMDYPEPEQKALAEDNGSEAIALFVQSARRLHLYFDPAPEREAIVRICQLVGGMPLGLVLAAAWTDILSPSEIAEEISQGLGLLAVDLNDLAARHRSIQAVYEQSWARLDSAGQRALAALSVFVGGFNREAAQAVAGAALRTLAVLADRSLLIRGEDGRYSLHELVRQFAGERLEAAGESSGVRQRHSRWFLDFAAQRERAIKGRGQEIAFAEMEVNLQNIRAGWRWAAENHDIAHIASALESLGIFYNRIQYRSEGESAMEQGVTGLGDPLDAENRLLHLRLQGWHAIFLHFEGHTQASAEMMEHCLESLNHPDLAGTDTRAIRAFLCLHRGGLVMGDLHLARTAREQTQAVALFEELGDLWWLVRALRELGNLEVFVWHFPQAKERLTAAREIAERIGDKGGLISVLDRLSRVFEEMGQVDEAEQIINDGILLNQNDSTFEMTLRTRSGLIKSSAGRFDEAADVLKAIIDRYQQLGVAHSIPFPFLQNALARVYIHLGRYEAALDIASGCVQAWKKSFGWEHPFLLRTVGRAHLGMGHWDEGHRILNEIYHTRVQHWADVQMEAYLSNLIYAQLTVGEVTDIRPRLSGGIKNMRATGAYSLIIKSLPAAGLVLAQAGQLPQAAALHQISLRYPHIANSRWYAVVAMDRLAELVGDVLPANCFDRLDTRADLSAITSALLALLDA